MNEAFNKMMAEMSESDSDDDDEDKRKYGSSSVRQPGRRVIAASNKTPDHIQKKTTQEEDIDNFASGPSFSEQPTQSQETEKISLLKRWLMRPCNIGDPPVLCYVERHRSGFGRINPTYKCFLEGLDNQSPRFLMTAKKKNGSKTSYYLISLDMGGQDDRGSESVLGKVRGNSVGSQYLITDAGLAPERAVAPSMLRKELGLVRFQFNSGGPSHIEAFVPSVNTAGIACVWQPTNEEDEMSTQIDKGRCNQLLQLVNKKPKWDNEHGGHVLNFQGRVTESSVKNFQLCPLGASSSSESFQDDVALQFGRVGKHRFSLDVRFPMSPIQAFAISVACMDGKIADRKGYEYLRKLSGVTEIDDHDVNQQAKGSVSGSSSFRGVISESMPSSQYLKDKLFRNFK